MINWILQKNLTQPIILNRIKSALIRPDESWEEVEVKPFSNQLPKIKNKNTFPIIYGSTTFMLNAYKNEALKAGVFYQPMTFHMQNYVAKWGDNVLNSDGQLIPFGQLKKLDSDPEKKWFIRPNDDGKDFSGRVDTFKALVNWSAQVCNLHLVDFNETTEVWIAPLKTIKKEWRLFIVDDKIVSSSRYMKNGKLDENGSDAPTAMLDFAKMCISTYRLHDVYVMDIAQIDHTYKLIECNCFNGTGFYGHDIEMIVAAINQLIRKNQNNR